MALAHDHITPANRATFVTDETLRILDWNSAAEEMYGWSAQEAVGKFTYEVIPADFSPLSREEMLAELFANGHWDGKVSQVRRDGGCLHLFLTIILLRDADERPIRIVHLNRGVTEQAAHSELQEAEERLRGIFENSADGIMVVGLDRRIESANSTQARVHGYDSPDELLGMDVLDLVEPSHREQVAEVLRQRFAGEALSPREHLVRRKDGSVFWVASSAGLIRGANGEIRGCALFNRDVTDRVNGLKQLAESEERYARLAEQQRVIAWQMNAQGVLGYVSENCFEIMGSHPDEVTGRPVTEFLRVGDGGAELTSLVDSIMETEPHRGLIFPMPDKQGRTVWLEVHAQEIRDEAGGLVGLRGSCTDVTLRVEYEHERARATAADRRFRTMFEKSPIGMEIIDAVTGSVLEVNESMCRLLGLSRERLVGLRFGHIVHSDDPELGRTKFRELTECKVSEYSMTKRIVSRDGAAIWVSLHVCPLEEEQGEIKTMLAMLSDVTEQREAHRMALHLNEVLEQRVAARTAELRALNDEMEAFAYSISHDLKTPMRQMSGFSGALAEEYGSALDGPGLEYLEFIREGGQRAGAMIDALLALSRQTSGPLECEFVDVSAMAETAVQVVRQAHPELRFETSIEPDLTCVGDSRMMQSVIQNLVENAAKYSAGCDSPKIVLRKEELDGVGWISIEDNGIGVRSGCRRRAVPAV